MEAFAELVAEAGALAAHEDDGLDGGSLILLSVHGGVRIEDTGGERRAIQGEPASIARQGGWSASLAAS